VLSPEEARRVLDAIAMSTHAGMRDRMLISLMVFSFARVGAALAMKVMDVFVLNRRRWVRLREKGGKRHEMPCRHNLETYFRRRTRDAPAALKTLVHLPEKTFFDGIGHKPPPTPYRAHRQSV
jgi:integrase